MLPCQLLFAALVAQSAIGFSTDAFLGEDFQRKLPPTVADATKKLQNLLKAHSFLHIHPPHAWVWGLSELEMFEEEYLPVLCKFVSATMQYPRLIREPIDPSTLQFELLELGHALFYLLDIRYVHGQSALEEDAVFGVAPGLPTLVLPINVAKARFMALRKLVYQHYARPEERLAASHALQWPIESFTFASMVDITITTAFIEAMVEKYFATFGSAEAALQMLGDVANDENYLLAQQVLTAPTERLPSLFRGLRGVAERLAKAQCQQSWFTFREISWRHISHGGALRAVEGRLQKDKGERGLNVRRDRLITLVNEFRARLLGETILLDLKTATIQKADGFVPLTEDAILSEKTWLLYPGRRENVAKALERVKDFAANNKASGSSEAFVFEMRRTKLLGGDELLTLELSTSGLLEISRSPLLLSDNVIRLKPETVVMLNDGYVMATQLVEAYGTVLELGIDRFSGTPHLAQFLLELFESPTAKDVLVFSKGIMDNLEPVLRKLGKDIEPYKWDEFALNFAFPSLSTKGAKRGAAPSRLHQTKAEEGEGESQLGKRQRSKPGGEEPDSKRRRGNEPGVFWGLMGRFLREVGSKLYYSLDRGQDERHVAI